MDYSTKLINLIVFKFPQFENLSPCNEGLHFLTERKKMKFILYSSAFGIALFFMAVYFILEEFSRMGFY